MSIKFFLRNNSFAEKTFIPFPCIYSMIRISRYNEFRNLFIRLYFFTYQPICYFVIICINNKITIYWMNREKAFCIVNFICILTMTSFLNTCMTGLKQFYLFCWSDSVCKKKHRIVHWTASLIWILCQKLRLIGFST